MSELILLLDGSVNAQSKIGYGAYLALSEPGHSLPEMKKQIKIKRFEQTSSTKLELQTLLWALSDLQVSGRKLIVYTDSQNIIGLPGRRDHLEKTNYFSSKNRRLNNYELYQEFYRLIDQVNYELIKVRGHQAASQKDDIDHLFTLVDKASRKAQREASK